MQEIADSARHLIRLLEWGEYLTVISFGAEQILEQILMNFHTQLLRTQISTV